MYNQRFCFYYFYLELFGASSLSLVLYRVPRRQGFTVTLLLAGTVAVMFFFVSPRFESCFSARTAC